MKKKSIIRDHNGIKYRVLKRWRPIHNRYRLLRVYKTNTSFKGRNVTTGKLKLEGDGLMTFNAGYEWDGPSGPTYDSLDFIRGSLGHDGKYELMRKGFLSQCDRWLADWELKRDCLRDGMPRLRAWWVFRGVRLFASFAARPRPSV